MQINMFRVSPIFRTAGVRSEDITSLEYLRNLPFVTKELIRDNLDDFTSREFDKKSLRYMTTGDPLEIPFGFWNTWKNYFIEKHSFIPAGLEQDGNGEPGRLY